jgi:integrase
MIDEIIAGLPTKVATFVQLLKETAMRSGEVMRLSWTDIDLETEVITLNSPEKGSEPRQWSNKGERKQLSKRLLAMLEALPKENELVFGTSTIYSLKNTFVRSRRRLSAKLKDSRLLLIHFHTMRHWRATLEYHYTRDLIHVKHFLGHKKTENTELYIQLWNKHFGDGQGDEWIVRPVHTEA